MKEILEHNDNWTLSKENGIFSVTPSGSASTNSISIPVGDCFIDKKQSTECNEYAWTARKKSECIYTEDGHAIKYDFQRIIINPHNSNIIYAQKDTAVYDTAPSVYKIKEYDSNLTLINNCLGYFCEDKYQYKKICNLDSNTYYHTCYTDYSLRIISLEGTDLRVISLNNKGDEEEKIFLNKVDSLYRITKHEGNVTYLFSFFVLETEGRRIIINLKSMKCIEKSFKTLFPTSFSLRSNDYSGAMERFVIKQKEEYLCIDNGIYDEELNKVATLATKWDANPSVLDTYDCFVAVSDSCKNIHIFKWAPWNKSNIEECKYICRVDAEIKVVGLIIDDDFNSNGYAPFDPIKQKFAIDVDEIKKHRHPKAPLEYNDNEEYCIMDALDGDPDAYWNID